jgi:hypothetical protein
MHLYEFLSCVATAVEDPVARANFVSDVLSDAISVLESAEFKQNVANIDSLPSVVGHQRGCDKSVERPPILKHVQQVSASFERVFSAFSQVLSVGKRCHEAKRRQMGLMPFQIPNGGSAEINFPDEGPVSLQDLASEDPFVPLWPRILPALMQIALDVTLRLWHPSNQANLLPNNIQRYVYAISDDEAFLSKVHDTKAGGVCWRKAARLEVSSLAWIVDT